MPLFRALAKNMAPMTNADESPTNHRRIALRFFLSTCTENIHTESYLSEKSVRCFFDCVCKCRVQMACTCLAAMFLASKCTCAV